MSAEPQVPDLWAITEYLAGRATPDRAREIEAWRDTSAAHGREFAALVTAWERTKPLGLPLESFAEREAWQVTAQRIRRPAQSRATALLPGKRSEIYAGGRESFKRQPLRRGVWYALAGATLAIATIVAGWRIGPRRWGSGNSTVVSYVTGNGQRANITLPDGSTVALNVASRLEVSADFLAGDHTLRLQGEALFTVLHHDRIPLTVLTGRTATRVLGTSFVVRRYATDTVTTVVVRDGKVMVDSAMVVANQLVTVRHGLVVTRGPAMPAQFSFAMGTLTLDGLRLPEAISELDRWYDADIRLGDPALALQGVGGKFAAGSLADLAKNLELTLNVRVVREGRVLTLFPR